MNKAVEKRKYSMKKRAAGAENNLLKVMQCTRELWLDGSLKDITLEQVAERSGVTVRTILRKFGSKEGLFEACVSHAAKTMSERPPVTPGDLSAAIDVLLDDYEVRGDAVIRTIQLQADLPVAEQILKVGRVKHRSWCEEVFEPFLSDLSPSAREVRLLAFIAATEIYLWKLLRRDLKKSRAATRRVFLEMIQGIAITQPT